MSGAAEPRADAGSTADRRPAILCISGPNLQLLGTREPHVYGSETLAQIHARLDQRARALGLRIDARQTNHEGTMVDWIGQAPAEGFSALLLNPGAYTHTSIALLDAVRAVALPCVEVHLSNPEAREAFRRRSYVARGAFARVAGFGGHSYDLALEGIAQHLSCLSRSSRPPASTLASSPGAFRPA